MTTITSHVGRPSRVRLSSRHWVSRLQELGSLLQTSWRRRQNLRALEALPADTLKDIGWPTTDNTRMRTISK